MRVEHDNLVVSVDLHQEVSVALERLMHIWEVSNHQIKVLKTLAWADSVCLVHID